VTLATWPPTTAAATAPPTTPAPLGPVEDPEPRPPAGLYVHVPFCVSLCPYCDFVVLAGAAARGPQARVASYLAAVHAELDLRADTLDAAFGRPGPTRPPLETLYLGGGTPSLLPPADVSALIDHVHVRFGLATDAEVTLEANPGTDERGDLPGFVQAGVNRISFGAQSLDEADLRRLGRRHRAEDVVKSVTQARAAGIRSISLDLLYDVPDSPVERWSATLEAAIGLAPDHLSLYALTLDDPDAEGLTGAGGDHLPTSRGARRWRERARPGQDEDRAAAAYELATGRLAAAGYRGYEISNWAQPGHESRHNLAYWQRRPYEALGPGAHAFDGRTRRWNAARLDGYVAALTPPTGTPRAAPPGASETLDAAAARAEGVVLALRTDRGVDASVLRDRAFGAPLRLALETGHASLTADERVVLTTPGRLVSNELFSRLL
jgi:oxygen-independent coproporphyrinogen-3 oxidase